MRGVNYVTTCSSTRLKERRRVQALRVRSGGAVVVVVAGRRATGVAARVLPWRFCQRSATQAARFCPRGSHAAFFAPFRARRRW